MASPELPNTGTQPTSLDTEIAAVKKRRRMKRRKVEWGDASDVDIEWAKSLSDSQLDLLVSVKQLAMERVRSTREKSLNGLLTPAGLRTIGIILEEFMMDRVQTLRSESAGSSSVIDDLRICIDNSKAECNEINHAEPAEGT